MKQAQLTTRRSQCGAALVIGLLLLLVLTVLALSSMNTASLDLIMAGNEQFRQNAFQASETGIEQALRNNDAFTTATPTVPFSLSDVAISGTTTDSYSYTVAIQLNGQSPGPYPGFDVTAYSTFHFEIASAAKSARNSSATHMQGIAFIAPYDASKTSLPGDNNGDGVINDADKVLD